MAASERERVAREALLEITPASTIGEQLGESFDDGVHTLSFAATVSGYPGWHWSASVVELDGAEPTVLEAELLPGEGALLAPDWVPWSQRLEEYRAAQAAAGVDGEGDEAVDGEGDLAVDGDDVDGEEDADDGDLDADDGDELDDDLDVDELDPADLIGDIDDVIDYVDDEASALLAVGEDEEDEAEPESDEDGPEPADVSGLDDR